MSRKRSRKVLYEVSSEAQKARKKRPKLEIARRARAFTDKVVSGRAVEDIREKSAIKPVGFKRNFIVLAGRLMNFSVKKALIVLVILIVVIKLLPDGDKPKPVEKDVKPDIGVTGKTDVDDGKVEPESGKTEVEVGAESGKAEVAGPPKDHYIVIASHSDVDQLKALAGYFAVNGIATEIKPGGGMNILITKDRYFKPGDPQSEVKKAKAKIQEVGNKYKPDTNSGYLRFKFDNIYEMKER